MKTTAPIAILVVALLLTACGDNGSTQTTSTIGTAGTTTAPATTLAVTTTAATPTTVPGGAVISVSNFKFEPADVTIAVGQTVTFSFQGGTHTATADDGAWSSGEKSGGENFAITLDQPGTYAFHCEIHGSMQGSITVTG